MIRRWCVQNIIFTFQVYIYAIILKLSAFKPRDLQLCFYFKQQCMCIKSVNSIYYEYFDYFCKSYTNFILFWTPSKAVILFHFYYILNEEGYLLSTYLVLRLFEYNILMFCIFMSILSSKSADYIYLLLWINSQLINLQFCFLPIMYYIKLISYKTEFTFLSLFSEVKQ